MKLNMGIIAYALPIEPQFVSGNPDHKLMISDVRFLAAENGTYAEEFLYFAKWEDLKNLAGELPSYVFCVGGKDEAADYMLRRNINAIVVPDTEPYAAFNTLQDIFLRFNQLENNLLTALHNKAPTREILNYCAAFFQNHAILYDGERNVIDYSDCFTPEDDDPYWQETLDTGRRSEKMLAEARKNKIYLDVVRTAYSDFVNLGPGLPTIMTYSFFDNGKRLATLTIAETNRPLSVILLKLMDFVSGLLSPSLFHIYSSTFGQLESLRSVLDAILNKESVDPLVVSRCLEQIGWSADDDYLLIAVDIPEAFGNKDLLTRYRHIYERIFPECVAFKELDKLVLIIHNDNDELMSECLPKLEKQLNLHKAICGLSFPFKGIFQISAHFVNAELAIRYGDKARKIRFLSDALTEHLVSRIATEIPLLPLCHRAAIRIYEYDQINHTDLLLTMETYLRQNKSLKASSEELFIHRSTMTYRLGCIEKLVSINLEDSRTRLHVLLSCIVLRVLGSHRQKNSAT